MIGKVMSYCGIGGSFLQISNRLFRYLITNIVLIPEASELVIDYGGASGFSNLEQVGTIDAKNKKIKFLNHSYEYVQA